MQERIDRRPIGRSFVIDRSRSGTTASVAVSGEIDLATAGRVAAALDEVLAAAPEILTVDLAGVEFLDSAGVSVLVAAYRRSLAGGVKMVLLPGPEHVQRTFALCGVLETLPFSQAAVPPTPHLRLVT